MQKRIAIVNDISGFGRCSVTVALPILSAMGISCGIVPTAILSNHTEYPEYSMLDFTPYMRDYISKWEKLQLEFDGIYTGFLGSSEQIHIISDMLSTFSFTQVIVDPVMGDHGVIYDSYTEEMCKKMKELVTKATVITPNLTELCILTDTPYHDSITQAEIEKMCRQLSQTDPAKIIVTGIENGNQIGNAIYEDGSFTVQFTDKVLPLRPGTGDVFASIIAGCSLHNISLQQATRQAASFIATCLTTSQTYHVPINDGVCFEEHLHLLYNK